MRNGLRECGCSLGTDPWDGEPVLGTGSHDVCDGPESVEQGLGRFGRDAGYRCKHCLVGVVQRRPLRIVGRVSSSPAPPKTEDLQPERGVLRARRPHDPYSKFPHRQERTSHRRRPERSSVDVLALDQEVGRRANPAEPPDLRPETTSDDRQVQVTHRLAFDECVPCQVVADRQTASLELDAELLQRPTKSALPLVDVHDDVQSHPQSLRFETERH